MTIFEVNTRLLTMAALIETTLKVFLLYLLGVSKTMGEQDGDICVNEGVKVNGKTHIFSLSPASLQATCPTHPPL